MVDNERPRPPVLELGLQFFDFLRLGLGGLDPFQHVGQVEDCFTIIGASPVQLQTKANESGS